MRQGVGGIEFAGCDRYGALWVLRQEGLGFGRAGMNQDAFGSGNHFILALAVQQCSPNETAQSALHDASRRIGRLAAYAEEPNPSASVQNEKCRLTSAATARARGARPSREENTTSLKLVDLPTVSQGSSCLATLGFKTPSLRDCWSPGLGFGFADLEADETADGDIIAELLAHASDVVAH